MPRIRTIKPEFWTDERLAECSVSARLLFIGLWNFADDNGNQVYSVKRIKMQIFPADSVDCQPLIDELIAQGVLVEYSSNEVKYLHIKGFSKHQRVDKPSKTAIPQPDFIQHSPSALGGLLDGREGSSSSKGKEINPSLPPLPVPKLNGVSEEGLKNDFEGAAACCCSLLNQRILAPSDAQILKGWLMAYDFEQKVKPILYEKHKKFLTKNQGKPPASLAYFNASIQERLCSTH